MFVYKTNPRQNKSIGYIQQFQFYLCGKECDVCNPHECKHYIIHIKLRPPSRLNSTLADWPILRVLSPDMCIASKKYLHTVLMNAANIRQSHITWHVPRSLKESCQLLLFGRTQLPQQNNIDIKIELESQRHK